MTIQSNLMTLQQIVEKDYAFRVPIYQRLYVWGDDQIKTLLADLLTAFRGNKDIVYLGGTLVVEREAAADERYLELVDGQQRFTTLWMMSLAWRSALAPFCFRQVQNKRHPRITFSIRPEVDHFFQEYIPGQTLTECGSPNIIDALSIIESFPEENIGDEERETFTRFIYERVQMVLTRVPAYTDLNKLFEVINNRGVQLQHHEILKAKLLSVLDEGAERARYALLWDACADMGSYVEQHLRDIGKVKLADLFDNASRDKGCEALGSAAKVLEVLAQQQSNAPQEAAQRLADILTSSNESAKQANDGSETDDESYESDGVRSIMTFPMLLQHTLRIWLHHESRRDLPRIHDKELLTIFDQHFVQPCLAKNTVTSFIQLLWEIRYCFDKHVIKWGTQGEEEVHLIARLYLNTNRSGNKVSYSLQRQRPTRSEGLALLQSMLYHSQQITTQYWLTPFLNFLHCHRDNGNNDMHFHYLKYLDNHLHCSQDARPLIQRSHDFLETPWPTSKNLDLDCTLLTEPLGVRFPHYWFYKLEFVLWDAKAVKMSEEQRNAFRITAKNSVEHISPQNPQEVDTNIVSVDVLDTFGNLALVSRSVNAAFSNKPFNEKRQRFSNTNRTRLDSLKMALIYQNESWNDALAQEHQKDMIVLLKNYIQQDYKGHCP